MFSEWKKKTKQPLHTIVPMVVVVVGTKRNVKEKEKKRNKIMKQMDFNVITRKKKQQKWNRIMASTAHRLPRIMGITSVTNTKRLYN